MERNPLHVRAERAGYGLGYLLGASIATARNAGRESIEMGKGEGAGPGRPKADWSKMEAALAAITKSGSIKVGMRKAEPGKDDGPGEPPMLIIGEGDQKVFIPVRSILVPAVKWVNLR